MNWYYFFGAWVVLSILFLVAYSKGWIRIVPRYYDLQDGVRSGGKMDVTNGEED